MISQRPDAIIIDSGSATGLNSVIAQACAAHIVVVSFDQQVTAPCAWKIGTNFGSIEAELATWLVTVLGDKGQIAVDRGLPGTPIADQMLSTELAVYKKFSGIHVVGEYNGDYAAGPEQEGVAAILASHPQLAGATGDGWGSSARLLGRRQDQWRRHLVGPGRGFDYLRTVARRAPPDQLHNWDQRAGSQRPGHAAGGKRASTPRGRIAPFLQYGRDYLHDEGRQHPGLPEYKADAHRAWEVAPVEPAAFSQHPLDTLLHEDQLAERVPKGLRLAAASVPTLLVRRVVW